MLNLYIQCKAMATIDFALIRYKKNIINKLFTTYLIRTKIFIDNIYLR